MEKLAVTTLCVGITACASSPDDLAARHVSALRYEDTTCKQLALETDHADERLGQLYASLDRKAGNDSAQMGIGLVLFWPALFFLEGGDGPEAGEYSRLRGEVEAMHGVAVCKECDPSGLRRFEPPPPGERAPAAPARES